MSRLKLLSVTSDLPPVSVGGYEVGVLKTSLALAGARDLDLWFLTSLRGTISGDIGPEAQILRILPRPGYFLRGKEFEAHGRVDVTNHQRTLAYDLMVEAIDMISPTIVIFWQTFFYEEACKSSLYDLRIISELNRRSVPYRIFLSGPGLLPIQFASLKGMLLRGDVRGLYRWYFYRSHIAGNQFPIETIDLNWEWVGFCSHFLKQHYLSLGFPATSGQVIHWGMDASRAEEHHTSSESSPLRVLWAGRICKDKGLHIVAQALKELNCKHFELDIYGYVQEPDYFASVQRELQLASADRVHYKGFIPPDELRNRLKHYDVFLLSSIYEEPFSIALLEAAAAGLALVASRTGGTPEFAQDKYALLYEAENAGELKSHLEALVTSPDCVNEWKEKASQGARLFTEQRAAERFSNWLEI